MLPDDGKALAAIADKFAPSVEPPPGGEEEMGGDPELEPIAQDLIDAVQSGDVAGVASALRAAFASLEAAPHEEADVEGE